jgi:hypothetical protein
MADRQAYTTNNPPPAGYGEARTVKAYGGTTSIVTGDLSVGKTTALFRVPAGFTVVNLLVNASDMDTNGTPTLTLSIGDAGSGTRFLNASTVGQAGTSSYTGLVGSGLGFQYTTETEILLTATAGAATAAAGTITVFLAGFTV